MHDLWDLYAVSVKVDRLTGGIPAHEKPLEAWLAANDAPPEAREDQARMVSELAEQSHTNIFYRQDGRPFYESRCLKAALRESANILKAIAGYKNYRSKLEERVFVGPRLIPIDATIQLAERPISVMTAQGPRTSLKRYEYAEDVTLQATLKVLKDPGFRLNGDDLTLLFEYAQENGIGADRSQGSGTFTLLSLDQVDSGIDIKPARAKAEKTPRPHRPARDETHVSSAGEPRRAPLSEPTRRS